jgi:hypothetical protein
MQHKEVPSYRILARGATRSLGLHAAHSAACLPGTCSKVEKLAAQALKQKPNDSSKIEIEIWAPPYLKLFWIIEKV